MHVHEGVQVAGECLQRLRSELLITPRFFPGLISARSTYSQLELFFLHHWLTVPDSGSATLESHLFSYHTSTTSNQLPTCLQQRLVSFFLPSAREQGSLLGRVPGRCRLEKSPGCCFGKYLRAILQFGRCVCNFSTKFQFGAALDASG